MKSKSMLLLTVVISLLTACNANNQNISNSENGTLAETVSGNNTEVYTENNTEAETESDVEVNIENSTEIPEFTMGDEAFTVKGFKCDIEKITDEPDYELLTMYEVPESDVSLCTYEDDYISNLYNNIVLKTGDKYIIYNEHIYFDEMIHNIEDYEYYGYSLVDPVHYISDDFDNDGDIELACSFILNRGTSYMNDKLCVFDYDKNEDTYNLYCLRFVDFSDAVTELIAKHYDSEYVWSELSDGTIDASNDVLGGMCGGMLYKEGEAPVRWGRWENVVLGNGTPMKIGMQIKEYPDGEIRDIAEIGCNVLYLGDGEFAVEFVEYNW